MPDAKHSKMKGYSKKATKNAADPFNQSLL